MQKWTGSVHETMSWLDCSFRVHSKNDMISHWSSSLQPVTPASCPQAENWGAEWPWQQQCGSVSSPSPFSEAHSSQRFAWQRNDTQWDSFGMKYSTAASPPTPVATTHKVLPTWPSQLRPFVIISEVCSLLLTNDLNVADNFPDSDTRNHLFGIIHTLWMNHFHTATSFACKS